MESNVAAISVRSSFRNESTTNKLFTYVVGFGVSGLFFALALVVLLATIFDPVGRDVYRSLIAIVLSLVMGLVFFGYVASQFISHQTLTLETDRIKYQTLWESKQIEFGNLIGGCTARKGNLSVMMVASRTGTIIGLGHGFSDTDKQLAWAHIRDVLLRRGIEVKEELTESLAIDWAKTLDEKRSKDVQSNAEETETHLITRVTLILGLGTPFILLLTVLGFGFISAAKSGSAFYLITFSWLLLSIGFFIAAILRRNERILLWGGFLTVLCLIPLGIYFAVAGPLGFDPGLGPDGWKVGLFLICIGFLFTWLVFPGRKKS